MPTSTREVRNGKPSRLAKGLVFASVLFGLAGCLTPRGNQAVNYWGLGAGDVLIGETLRKEIYGGGQSVDTYKGKRVLSPLEREPWRYKKIDDTTYFDIITKEHKSIIILTSPTID